MSKRELDKINTLHKYKYDINGLSNFRGLVSIQFI